MFSLLIIACSIDNFKTSVKNVADVDGSEPKSWVNARSEFYGCQEGGPIQVIWITPSDRELVINSFNVGGPGTDDLRIATVDYPEVEYYDDAYRMAGVTSLLGHERHAIYLSPKEGKVLEVWDDSGDCSFSEPPVYLMWVVEQGTTLYMPIEL